jgi:hypothetical protein
MLILIKAYCAHVEMQKDVKLIMPVNALADRELSAMKETI